MRWWRCPRSGSYGRCSAGGANPSLPYRRRPSRRRIEASLGLRALADLRLHVVLDADPGDEVELDLEPVDMLFLAFQDVLEQLARDVVARFLAVDDARLEHRVGVHLQLEVALERLFHALANEELVEVLQVG